MEQGFGIRGVEATKVFKKKNHYETPKNIHLVLINHKTRQRHKIIIFHYITIQLFIKIELDIYLNL